MSDVAITALISGGVVTVYSIMGWVINRWFNSQDKDKDNVDANFKEHKEDCDKKLKDQKSFLVGEIDEAKETLSKVVTNVNKINSNQGRNFERIGSIEKSQQEHLTNCPIIGQLGNIKGRITKLDGGSDFGAGQVASNAEDITKLRKVMSIASDVKNISSTMTAISNDMKEFTQSMFDLKIEISEKYVNKKEYDEDRKSIQNKLNQLIKVLVKRKTTGQNTSLQMIIDPPDEE